MKLQLFLLITAFLVLVFTSDSITDGVLLGTRQMSALIGLLLIVPMISWVLKEEPYIEEILSFAHVFLNNSRKFYFGITSMTQIIAHFLLFGSVSMMYQFINSILNEQKGEAWENYKGTAILRGFALSTLWVISIPSFIFALETLGVPLWKAILQGFIFAMIGTLLAVVFSVYEQRKYGLDYTSILQKQISKAQTNSRYQKGRNKDVIEFGFLFTTLFGTIFIVHAMLKIELLIVIPIVIPIWTSIYYLIKKRSKSLVVKTQEYFKEGIALQSQQISILLATGLLIFTLNESGIGAKLVNAMHSLTEIIPLLNFLLLIPFIVILLGFLGLGPLSVIVLVAGIVGTMELAYPSELLLLAITSGSVISILLSPFIIPVIMLSSENGLSPIKNGFQFNLKFATAFYCIVQVYLQTMIHI
ncbi:hypothetical protein ACXYMX_09560 [Sporosarcina sp. CAU 1771]